MRDKENKSKIKSLVKIRINKQMSGLSVQTVKCCIILMSVVLSLQKSLFPKLLLISIGVVLIHNTFRAKDYIKLK